MKPLKEVGIYRVYTAHPKYPHRNYKPTQDYVLVMRSSEGTSYFKFNLPTFLTGWYQANDNPDPRASTFQMLRGAIQAIQPVPPLAKLAFESFKITPSFLNTCGKTSKHRIKWALPRDKRKVI